MKSVLLLVYFATTAVHFLNTDAFTVKETEKQEHISVTRLREYLRFDTSHPNPSYDESIAWIREQAKEIELDFHYEHFEGEDNPFALWLTWNGTDQSLKSILINTHMDVVAANGNWLHPPFDAYKDDAGWIYGRGTIDMKSSTVAALEALRRLKENINYRPLRTIHLSVMPDEEVGGRLGTQAWVETGSFKSLNVGVDIDESEINEDGILKISNAEKAIWQFTITARRNSSHASTLPNETATDRLHAVVEKLLAYRRKLVEEVENNDNITYNDVTTINWTQLGGGVANNIIPEEVWATFDMRVLPKEGWNFTDIDNWLREIVSSDEHVSLTYLQQWTGQGETSIVNNVWWKELMRICEERLNITCQPQTISGATDGRYIRSKGIDVFGIHPILRNPKLQHQVNEMIHENEFVDSIGRFEEIIKGLSMLPWNEKDE